ncbi:DUF2637 domain-containing protein [Streptomyces sp. cg36]|uniref:DUF2637 domain-containing protein n=1 Tax=Streptomyces sp. cg36 TaxID=3238798 RepID=UPI0034E26A11
MVFGRVHRVVTTVVVAGAVIIAGIGFAGSYAAVRALAERQGFGTFSLVFPVGIDAGICVLLALDLLLTWIRIPFPLLRQTAWLLTAATIAFNSAAAWPDALGVGMHAVIPVLFVVAVEAARHAVGRIADITADKHMEGVRYARWLLCPVPTFKLWRRMKLWELRSYEQVIKLEQDRLVYQARLQARYGRAWRRKAPVESLMPLRLAKFGVPLADTGPAGLAAAGIKEPLLLPDTQAAGAGEAVSWVNESRANAGAEGAGQNRASPPAAQPAPIPVPPGQVRAVGGRSTDADAPFPAGFPANLSAAPEAVRPRCTPARVTGPDEPLSAQQLQPLLQADQHRSPPHPQAVFGPQPLGDCVAGHHADVCDGDEHKEEHPSSPDAAGHAADTGADAARIAGRASTHAGRRSAASAGHAAEVREGDTGEPSRPADPALPAAVGAGARGAARQRGRRVNARLERPPSPPGGHGRDGLTASDRYYLAWRDYQEEHGAEPSDGQLSAHLAAQGLLGRGGRPVSPANLRRHFVRWRIYTLWAQHRAHTGTPAPAEVARACGRLGITAQYGKPVTPELVAGQREDFERRWHTLTHHPTPDTP